MSKKRTLLGPDGKPLDVARYRPAPKAPEVARYTFVDNVVPAEASPVMRLLGGSSFSFSFRIGGTDDPPTGGLREAVSAQLAAIHDGLADLPPAPPELPPPPPERTDTYEAAFGSAARRCPHPNSVSTLHARRERQCLDCGRYFTRKEWYE